MLPRPGLVLGLAERLAVDEHLGIAPDDQRLRPGLGGHRRGLPSRVLEHDLLRLSLGQLLDLHRLHLELDPKRIEQRAALRRAGCEYDSQP
jgi:hypothetical protein